MTRPTPPILDRVTYPADLRRLTDDELARCADELRAETISAVSETGGHLGSSLGVVELTVAIHAVFNTPYDKLSGMLVTSAIPTRSSPAAATGSAPCARSTVCPVSPSGRKANTIRLARHIPQPRFPPRSASPWRANWAGDGRRDRRHRRRVDLRWHGL
jgi:hypothetical protein